MRRVCRIVSHCERGLENGKTYYFKVLAVNEGRSTMGVPSGYTFGEMTAVTPNSELDKHARVFKGYLRSGKVHFLWDAIINAESYRLYSAPAADGFYEIVGQVVDNFYELPLPVTNKYYKMAAVFSDSSEGPLSQFIELIYRADADWTLANGINVVTVNINNFSDYAEIDLACKGVDETVWFSAAVTHTPFSAGPLEPMDYDCRLSLKYSDDVEAVSDIKRATVYPAPDPNEKISVYVWERNATLTWDRHSNGEIYEVLLVTNGDNLTAVANNLTATEHTLTDLKCADDYTAYINIKKTGGDKLSSPVSFKLDGLFCALNPDPIPEPEPEPEEPEVEEQEGINRLTVLETTNNPPYRNDYGAVNYNNKLYIFGGHSSTYLNDLWVFDPDTFVWTKLNPSGTLPSKRILSTLFVIRDKIYMYGGKESSFYNQIWEYDPHDGTDGSWKKLSPPTMPLASHIIGHFVYNDKLYAISYQAAKLWVYDRHGGENGIWTQISASAPIGTYANIFIIDNMFYVTYSNVARLYKFDWDNSTWSYSLIPSEMIRSIAAAPSFIYNNKIYYLMDKDVNVYDPATEMWNKTAMPGLLGFKGYITVKIKNKIYIFGGDGTNSTLMYEP